MRAVNQTYYFKDAFYYLASCLTIENQSKFKEALKAFLSTETAKIIKSQLNAMLKGNIEQREGLDKVLSFPSI